MKIYKSEITMRNSLTKIQAASARQTTTVFTSGNSQAVRLPKAFRFDSKTVEIERRGDEIVLRAKRQTVGDILRQLAQSDETARGEWARLETLVDDPRPQDRDWSALLERAQSKTVAKKAPDSKRKKATKV